MTVVRDIMSTRLTVADPEASLRSLVELLAEKHIGGVPVLQGGQVAGVVSMDDVMTFLSSQPVVPRPRPDDQDYEEEEPGTSAEAVEGVEAPGAFFADAWADAGADVVERFASTSAPEWDLLGEHTVAEAMTRKILSVRPSASVVEAARAMKQAGVHRLLVMDKGALVGIITTTDVSNVVAAEGRPR